MTGRGSWSQAVIDELWWDRHHQWNFHHPLPPQTKSTLQGITVHDMGWEVELLWAGAWSRSGKLGSELCRASFHHHIWHFCIVSHQLPITTTGLSHQDNEFFFLKREKDQWNFMKYICFQVQYCNSNQCHHHNHHHPPVSKQVGLQMARLSIEENKYCLGGKEELNVQHI